MCDRLQTASPDDKISRPNPALSKLVLTAGLVKFSHSVFALPFAAIALVLVYVSSPGKTISPLCLAAWLVCMVSARAFAMTFNRLADLPFDAANPRTASRELPSKKLSLNFARSLLAVFAIIVIASSSVFYFAAENPWPLLLSPLLLAFLAAYSFTKRFTVLCHFWLGASLGLAPVATWIALAPPSGPLLSWPPLVLAAAVTFWTAGFDIIYSLSDIDFDRRTGLFSIPARFGIPRALLVSRLCHVLTIIILAGLLFVPRLGPLYTVALAASALVLSIQHWLIRKDLARIDAAFFTVNGCFSILFGIMVTWDLLNG